MSERAPIEHELELFRAEWDDPSPYMTVQTSGSTGTPKQMRVLKERMRASARLTCQFLGLKKSDTALLCMPLRYIAGKMVVVRALEWELKLLVREPSGHPLAEPFDGDLDFAAMIPLQVYNSLQVPAERERLTRIRHLIIGGGAIDRELEVALRPLPNRIYSTYGMTETLSHVAMRRLNGPEASEYYEPFPSVQLSLSPDQTLEIDAPLVCDGPLVTNDVVDLQPDGRFRVIGRKDNIINSGGVKIQIETVEAKLRPFLTAPFAITALPDPKFGEAIVLLTTAVTTTFPPEALDRYERPKQILRVEAIPMTGSGKIDRAACRRLAIETNECQTSKSKR